MKQIVLIPVIVLICACGDSGQSVDEQPAPGANYIEAHAAAVAAIENSVSRGHAWSTADALLEEAAVAAAGGDDALAIQLADNARIQAELSIRQADFEETAWKDRVLSD